MDNLQGYPRASQRADLRPFIGQVVAAYGDDRVFDGSHWHFDEVGDELKTLHYVAGKKFYLDGKGV